MKSTLRRSVSCLALVAAAIAAAGCEPVIDAQEATQPAGVGGLVDVATSFCIGGGDPANPGDSASCDIGYSVGRQLLIAYEVPAGTAAASASLVPPHEAGTAAPAAVALSRDGELEAWLDATQPAAAGRAWVGFRSGRTEPVGTSSAAVDVRASATVAFDAPQGAAPGFAYRTVAFTRTTTDDDEAAAPFTACDSSDGCTAIEALDGVATDGAVAIRDADLAAPAGDVTAPRGSTATVPFTVAYRGAAPSGDLQPTATTTLAGAKVAPLAPVALAATGDQAVDVKVDVPADAPLGAAKVTVELPLADGAVREATRTLVVTEAPKTSTSAAPAPAAPKPAAKPVLTPAQLQAALTKGAAVGRASLTKGITLKQSFPSAGDAAFELRIKLGAGRERALTRTFRRPVPKSGVVDLSIPLAGQGRTLLAGRTSAKVVLVVRYHHGGQGSRVKVRIPVVLR